MPIQNKRNRECARIIQILYALPTITVNWGPPAALAAICRQPGSCLDTLQGKVQCMSARHGTSLLYEALGKLPQIITHLILGILGVVQTPNSASINRCCTVGILTQCSAPVPALPVGSRCPSMVWATSPTNVASSHQDHPICSSIGPLFSRTVSLYMKNMYGWMYGWMDVLQCIAMQRNSMSCMHACMLACTYIIHNFHSALLVGGRMAQRMWLNASMLPPSFLQPVASTQSETRLAPRSRGRMAESFSSHLIFPIQEHIFPKSLFIAIGLGIFAKGETWRNHPSWSNLDPPKLPTSLCVGWRSVQVRLPGERPLVSLMLVLDEETAVKNRGFTMFY